MASKQIAKFTQRVGEIVSRGQTKTTFSDDFKELEADMQVRGAGLEKLSDATDAYIRYLEKKKEVETDAEGKLKISPFEALGVTMMAHGGELGEESVYGAALSQMGRVHCNIATLQEEYATALRETYYQKLDDGILSIQEYQGLRKKLDSRRLALDTYATKVAKAKKDKDREEAEEEYETAKQRYEEMSEEVQDRMLSIQKREGEQLAELTEFLDSEMSFVTVYYDMLLKLKQEWPSAASANTKKLTHRRSLTKRPNDDSPRPSNEQSFTVRTRSKSTVNEGAVISIFATPPDVQDRKRSDSVATAESKDKSETAPPTPKSRKTSVSGWVGSFSRSRKNSSVSKKNFQSLLDDEEANQTTPTAPTFFRSSALALDDTPSTELRDRKPSNGERVRRSSVARRPPTLRKIRAMHDMINHAPDELPFRTGETLTVLDPSFTGDVEDTMTWVRAEREGYVGMVPLNYFEVLPRLTHKTSNTRKPTVGYFGNDGGSSETEDPESPSSSLLHDYGDTVLVSSKRRGPGANDVFRHYEPATTDNFTRNRYDDDDEHPFNDPVYDDSEQAHATRMENFLGFEPTAYLKAKKAAASSSSDRSRGSDELDTNNNNNPSSSFPNLLSPPNTTSTSKGRPFRTAPPSPNRPPAPIPTSSSRQLPQNVANAVAAAASGKKPPPPPPPTRRAQSSTNITQGHGKGGSVNGSVSSLSSLTGGAREPPPPPPMRRPTQQGRESESPFN